MKGKKLGRVLRSIFGWLMIVYGGISGVSEGWCALLALFGLLEIDYSLGERLIFLAMSLVMAVGSFTILWLGLRLKNGGHKDKKASPVKENSDSEPSNSRVVPEPPAPADDELDDVTFIKAMRHIVLSDGVWHQYDVLLDASGYGWDMMKDWADYMATADLEQISEVAAGTIHAEKQNVTESYTASGGKCRETPELDTEQGMLSIAGLSKTLGAPVKIVWINQTRTLRFFTIKEDDLRMRKYVETMVRRSFGTENAMKLGKPAQSAETPAPPTPEKTPVPPGPEKPQPGSTPQKLDLGTFFFTDADRQKLAVLPKKGLPEKTNTPEAQIALLDVLDSVMDTNVTRLKTTIFWSYPDGMPEEEKTKQIRADTVTVILSVNDSLPVMNPDFLRKKVEEADFEQLLNAWTVLNYYSDVLKPQYSENIRNFRDYIHNALLTRYGGSGSKRLIPARLEGTGIYVKSAELLEWLNCNRLAGQYELRGVMPLTEKEPVITLYEDGVKTREYRLQTEKDEDFTGKYFQIAVRMGMQGNPSVPVVQTDGFLSDTPEERNMTTQDIGYRMEGHFLACGGKYTQIRREGNRGQDLPMKALKYVGYTTPSNIRMIGICPDCGKSFSFHSYCVYMADYDVAYSDDGQDCCQISAHNVASEDWKCQVEGKTFRYYNSFCCPHCGTPYIDYRKFPEIKKFGVCGCVHLGRKLYKDVPNP